MKKNIIIRIFLLLIILFFAYYFSANYLFDDAIDTIYVFHTNDVHGRVLEGQYAGMGMTRIASLVNNYRDLNKNVLFFDAGDMIHGMPIATLDKGKSIIKIMNMMKYDAMVPGNHDFNYGYKRLLELNQLSNFPVLAANVKKDGELLFDKYIIKSFNNIKVGIFGLATPETVFKSHPDGVKGLIFENPVETAKNVVDILYNKVDIIILLTHLGLDASSDYYYRSSTIAKQVSGITLIVDGHSHHRLEQGKLINNTLIVSAHEYNKELGAVEIIFNRGNFHSISAKLISKEEGMNVQEDADVLQLVNKIINNQNEILSEVIGYTTVELNGAREFVRNSETNLGNLICDAILKKTGADIVLINGGTIRSSISAGYITVGNIIEVLPFGNSVITKKLSGTVIKEMLEIGANAYPEPFGGFLHSAGIKYTLDATKPKYSRISNIYIAEKLIDFDKKYIVATTDFLAAGGDGYNLLIEAPVKQEYGTMDSIIINYIKNNDPVNYIFDNSLNIIK